MNFMTIWRRHSICYLERKVDNREKKQQVLKLQCKYLNRIKIFKNLSSFMYTQMKKLLHEEIYALKVYSASFLYGNIQRILTAFPCYAYKLRAHWFIILSFQLYILKALNLLRIYIKF